MAEVGQENVAFEPTTQTHIRFNSKTDAVLAEMLFKEELGIQKFNQLLTVLRNPEFDVKDVTFKNPLEIFHHVASKKQEAAVERSGNIAVAGMPSLVLSGVIRTLVEEVPSIEGPEGHRPLSEAERTLLNMTLAHRSWSFLAQKGLGERVFIRGTASLRAAMLSPLLGSWTKQLAYKWVMTTHWRNGPIPEDPEETYTLLGDLLGRLTGLQRLSLWSMHNQCGDAPVCPFMNALESAPSLEYLWLSHDFFERGEKRGNGLLPLLCETLPKMQRLKSLSFTYWTCDKDATIDLEGTAPGRNLKQLALMDVGSPSYTTWLTRPRGDFALSKINTHISKKEDQESTACYLNSMAPCLSALQSMRLSVSIEADDSEPYESRSLSIGNEMLNISQKLKDLTINAYANCLERGLAPPIAIPDNVERLCFSFSNYDSNNLETVKKYWSNVGETLFQVLTKRVPKLKMLIVVHIDQNRVSPAPPDEVLLDEARQIPYALVRVAELCDERGIEFLFLYEMSKLRELGMD